MLPNIRSPRPRRSQPSSRRPVAATLLVGMVALVGTACAGTGPLGGLQAGAGSAMSPHGSPDDTPDTAAADPASTVASSDTTDTTDTTADTTDTTDTTHTTADATGTTDPGSEPDPDGSGIPDGPFGFESTGGDAEPPVQPEQPQPPQPDWDSVQLAPVATGQPSDDLTVAVPGPLPDPVPVGAVGPIGGGAPGGLTSAPVGCSGSCLVSAVLSHRSGTPDLGFDATTNVATEIAIWIRTLPPVMTPSGPRFLGQAPTAVSPAGSTSWSTELGELQYSTTYHVLVRATDLYGNEQWAGSPVTTQDAPGPDQLTGSATGCALACISSAIITPGAAYHHVHLAVTTDTAADISVAVSAQEPGWIGDAPLLPADETFAASSSTPTSLAGDITGLEGSTTYHVVVRAEDADGSVHWAVGEFTTAAVPPRVPDQPDDVFIAFERVEIVHDGDPQAGNRGEALFSWTVLGTDLFGHSDQRKIADGDTISLPDDAGTWVSVEPGDDLPVVLFNVREADWRGPGPDGYEADACSGGVGVYTEPTYHDGCDTRTSVAGVGGVDVAWIGTLMPCTWFLLEGATAEQRCIELQSAQPSDDYARFTVLVSFTVA